MRIALASSKGGAGKTSLSAVLTLAFVEAGKTVRVEDHDPQQGLMGWLQFLKEKQNFPLKKNGVGFVAGEGDPSFTLADFPPADPASLKKMTEGFDRIVIPTQPSSVDVESSVAFVALFADRARLKVVWNCLDGSSLSRPEALALWGERLCCPIAKTTIPRRIGFKNAQLVGFRGLDEASKTAVFSLALELTSDG